MKLRAIGLVVLLLFTKSTISLAQEWVEKMQDPQVNFYEVQAAFQNYWGNQPVIKGKGWKQYKRWEYFNSLRIDELGNRPAPQQVQQAYFQRMQQFPQPLSLTGAWTELGPVQMPANGTGQPNGLGRINCVTFHPSNPDIIFVGAPSGGLWRTTNGGATWTSNTDQQPTLGVSSILFDPSNPSIVYLGTGDRDGADAPGLGVRKSTDGGITWSVSSTGMGNRTVSHMLIHPTNSNIIIAATSSGIYRSTNAGGSWTLVSSNSSYYKDLSFRPGDPNIVYATASGLFYRSTNNGASWSQVSIPVSGSRLVIGVSPADPNVVYLCQTNGPFAGLLRSTDSGLSFSTMSTTPNIMGYECDGSDAGSQAWYDLCIAVDPLNANIVYVGGINIWKSTNAGATWSINTHWTFGGCGTGRPAVHADIHSLNFNPLNNRLYSGNDGGVHYTANGGNTWIEISSGLGIAQIYKIGQSALVKNQVINGYQDNGTAVLNGSAFTTEIGGDGMECIVDYSNSNVLYGALYYGDIRRSTNAGLSFSIIGRNGSNGINEQGSWVTPYIQHVVTPSTLFAGYINLWRTTNANAATSSSVTWSSLTSHTGSTMRVIEQSVADPNVLYYTRNGGERLVRSDNINLVSPTFTNLDAFMTTTDRPLDIATHPTDANTVYVTNSSGGVYKSINKGQSWSSLSTGLPALSINCIVFERGSNQGLYVGSDAGVYYRDSTMSAWQLFNTGLPVAAEVTELEIWYHPTDRNHSRIRASTYGRGLWESDLYGANSSTPPVADFMGSPSSITVGQSVGFTDLSTGNPNAWTWSFPGAATLSSNLQNPSNIVYNTPGCYAVSLVASNSFGPSAPVTKTCYINVTGPTYCLPNPAQGTSDGDFINGVQLGSISNLNSGGTTGPNYTFYSSLSTNLTKGQSHTLTITGGTYSPDVYAAWIDLNGDLDFNDTGEKLGEVTSNASNQQLSISFTIPVSNPNLSTRLRVRCAYNAPSMSPCTDYQYGETEDYIVHLVGSVPPTAQLSNNGMSSAICAGSTVSMNISLTGSSPWNVVLRRNGSPINVNNITTTPYTYSTLISAAGVDTFRISSVSDATTLSSADQGSPVIYQTSAAPSNSNAGADQNVCSSTSSLSGNVPLVGSGVWTSLNGASLTNSGLANSGVSGLVVGQNRFVWTISNGNCPASRDTVVIVRNASPTVSNAGTDQSVCATTSTLAGNTATVGSGQWASLTTATVSTPTSATSGVTGLVVGPNLFVWTINNGNCPASRDTVVIVRNASPTVSNAGTDQSVCATTSTLAGNTATVGSGQWASLTTATVSTPTSATSGVTGLVVGQNVFVWTISNGNCPASRDTVVIVRYASPTVSNAGLDQSVCATTSTLAGNTATVGSGQWASLTTATVSTPTSATSGVTGLVVGQNVFVWTISNGNCLPSRDTVVIVRNASPTVSNAGTNQSVCATTSSLAGNTATVGAGQWASLTTATVSTPTSATSGVTGLVVGQNLFVWTISNGNCPASRDTVVIVRNASPTVSNAGTDQSVCATTSSLAGNTATVGAGQWASLTTATVSTPTSATSGVKGLVVGPNLFVWTINNGNCPASRDTVVIVRNASPTVSNAGTDQSVCATTSTLAGNTATVGAGQWASLTTATVSTPALATSGVTGLVVGPNLFVWTISNGNCPASRDTVNIQYSPAPIAQITVGSGSPIYCIGSSSSVQLTASPTGMSEYRFYKNGQLIQQGTQAIAQAIMGADTGNILFSTVVLNSANCADSASFNLYAMICTGIQSGQIGTSELSIFPNPAQSELTIIAPGLAVSTLKILDMKGVEQEVVVLETSIDGVEINIEKLASGLYAAQIRYEGGQALLRFVKI
jgi:hypothetical protein